MLSSSSPHLQKKSIPIFKKYTFVIDYDNNLLTSNISGNSQDKFQSP